LNHDYITEKVKQIKQIYDHEKSPYTLCFQMGIRLNHMNYGCRKNCVKGFSIKNKKIKCITYNCDLPRQMQEQIIWHEIGHCVLHDMETTAYAFANWYDISSSKELEANLFSAEYQLDDEDVLEAMQEYDTFQSIARSLCVPEQVLDFKFRMMKNRGLQIEPPSYTPSKYLKNFQMPKGTDDFDA